MAQIRITAELKDLPHGYRSFGFFRTKEGRRMEAEPIVDEKAGEVAWLVPDTDENRELFEKNFAEDGVYSAKDVNSKEPVPFKAGANAEKPPNAAKAKK